MEPALLIQFYPALGGEKQQSPEHPDAVTVKICGCSNLPLGNELIETHPIQGGVPTIQKHAQGRGGFRQFFAVGESGNLSNGLTVAVALLPFAAARSEFN